MGHLITANEAAVRLGVDVRTLYAYVSRGSLSRRGVDTKRRSLYDADEVELLARRGRPRTIGRSRVGIDVVIGSAVSAIGDGWIRYRSDDAIALAVEGVAFERVAILLWTGALPDKAAPVADADWAVPRSLARALTRTLKAFGATANINARMAAAIAVADAHFDTARDGDAANGAAVAGPAEFATARALVAVLAAAATDSPVDDSVTIAERLWQRLSPMQATPNRVAAMNRALVLLADHELATSTLAVRIATSTRASLGSALLCGLATLSGSAHGGMAAMVHDELVASRVADRTGAGHMFPDGGAADDESTASRPGFGHPVHAHGDPRAEPLLAAVRSIASPRVRAAIANAQLIGERRAPANSDFALGALCYAGRMAPGSAEAIFAVARSAGWIAHATEESAERPLRFRGRAVPRLPAPDRV